MTAGKPVAIQRHWLAKILAGLLPGLGLAMGSSALLVALTPDLARAAQSQLAMWLVMPVWLTALGLVFLTANGWRAWLWLLAANAGVWGSWALLIRLG